METKTKGGKVHETLKHNSFDSVIRRPAGFTDEQWNIIVIESASKVTQDNPLMRTMAEYALQNEIKPIIKILGLKPELPYQNWEHTAYRFFRHFCPENMRNAMSHSGLPFATLEYDNDCGFSWTSAIKFTLFCESQLSNSLDIKKGDEIVVLAEGKNDVDMILLKVNNDNVLTYYKNGVTKSFGDTMYLLKKMIVVNKKKKEK